MVNGFSPQEDSTIEQMSPSWPELTSVLNQKFLCTLCLDGDGAAAEPFDGGQDVVGGLGPAERLGIGIAGVDVGGDGGLQLGVERWAPRLICCSVSKREEALDLVDP